MKRLGERTAAGKAPARPGVGINATGVAFLVLLLTVSGCLPSSCRRMESTSLTPADSLSRQIAETVPTDSLTLRWQSAGTTGRELEYPRTVSFGSGGSDTLFVSDVKRNSIFVFNTGGNLIQELPIPGLSTPYIAGVRADTLAVFSPGSLRLDFISNGRSVTSFSIADEDRNETSLVYAAVSDAIFYKRVGPEAEGFIGMVDPEGQIKRRIPLSGPHWRQSGLLRLWGDTLLSLSGFRPVVDLVHVRADTTTKVETLALRGFDSPMLARSRSFMEGETHQAPLLTTSAASAGDLLFVLNLRPGWLQVDVYDRDGLLRRRLNGGEQEYRSSFYPYDLDIRETIPGTYDIAVVLSEPEPMVRMYRWVRSSSVPPM